MQQADVTLTYVTFYTHAGFAQIITEFDSNVESRPRDEGGLIYVLAAASCCKQWSTMI